ncbi:MAG: reverse transcriptase domain-containing protein [Burkholderiales bacterium]
MPRKVDDLYDRIVNFHSLREAALRAVRGKRRKPAPAAFMANLEREVLRLERELSTGTWKPGGYVTFRVEDPKPRMISAAPFRDRVVHHALCKVVEPIFERGFIDDSFANRVGRGSHRAISRYEHFRDRHACVLRCDIFRYFPSIDHAILKREYRRRIGCARTLTLMDAILDASNPQEPVELYFLGDDLFSPFARRRGLPIGNLTSQFFANLYLDPFDHFVKEILRAPYVRYVDDFALFHDDPMVLAEWRSRIGQFLEGRRLTMHPRKTFIAPTDDRATFLGFDLDLRGRRSLPEANVRRFRNRLRGLRGRWRAGTIRRREVERHVDAWIAHARHAHSWRLRQALFERGWFDPSHQLLAEPDRP